MSNSKIDTYCHSDEELVRLIDARLAKSTLFQGPNPHIHVVPSTSNPACLGFYGFGFCCIMLMAVFTEWVPPEAIFPVYAYSFTFAGLGQVIVGILEFQRKNVFATNAFITYGMFFFGFALEGTLQAAGVWVPSPKAAQLTFALWGCITFLFWIQTLVLNAALSALFLTVCILFFCAAAAQTNPAITKGTGWFGLFAGIIAIYVGTAIFFVENYGKEVLPMGHFNWSAVWRMGRRLGPVGTKRDLETGKDATNA